MTLKRSDYKGVFFREHATRKHGKAPDKYIVLRHYVNGKQIDEGLGWMSEKWDVVGPDGSIKKTGWTPKGASELLAEFSKNKREGKAPRSLAEMRELQTIEKDKAERDRRLKHAELITVSDFWDKSYLHHLKTRGLKPASYEKEIMHYENRIRPAIGDRPLKSITEQDVESIRDKMYVDEYAPRTVQYCIGTIYRIWKHASRGKKAIVKAGENPAIGVPVPQVNNTRTRVLTPPELKKILEYLSVTDPAAYDITLFAAYTGCRLSEAANLKWEYVNLTDKTILFPTTKNNESRQIHLSGVIVNMLNTRGTGETGEYVFIRSCGKPFLYKNGAAIPPCAFNTAVKNLKLNDNRGERDRVIFHTLRHTAATLTANRGIPAKDLQLLFGWKTPSMVFRYVKGDIETQKRAVDGLATALDGEKGKVVQLTKKVG